MIHVGFVYGWTPQTFSATSSQLVVRLGSVLSLFKDARFESTISLLQAVVGVGSAMPVQGTLAIFGRIFVA
jgi:hypothetical protein